VRDLLEDVPFSLRSVQILGKIAKVPTPVIDSVCTIGEALVGDVMAEGYTMEALGLSEDIGFDEFVALCNG
ncbi:MAG: NAD/NADP octopine/nopaline dehydrogenase family protein, partial [Oscillospiraceae bacterium]